jgi:hypothetical protein
MSASVADIFSRVTLDTAFAETIYASGKIDHWHFS